MYNEDLIERFRNPKFAGEMKDSDAIGEEGNVRCGDVMQIFLKVKDDIITDISFLTYGCVAAIATTDALCEMAKGKTLEDAEKIQPKDIVAHLGDVPPIKFHCSVLGDKALQNAIKIYREKQSGEGSS
ncbi:iron-sulfur cluster assembly scaffold protein [Candidatus Woesearchaeota archaeon]|nr:iron-sulfur cluster assembly scaffold protein [Candidatus Woesearchaeota archaeon]